MALNISSFTSGYNAYNIPSVKDNPQVAPQPELQPQSKQAQQEKEQEKRDLTSQSRFPPEKTLLLRT